MKNNRRTANKIFLYLIIILGAIVFLIPYVYMIFASTQNNEMIIGGGLNFKFGSSLVDNWNALMSRFDYGRVLFNSLFIACASTFLATASSTMAGYALAKFDFRGNKTIFRLIMLARMVPGFTTLIPLFYLLSRMGLTNSYAGLIIPAIAATSSVFIMRQYIYQFPNELLESARIDGASEWRIFISIVIPVLKPTIITNALLIFMGSWNSYLFPLVMISDPKKFTVSLVIKNMSVAGMEPINYGALMLVLTISVIPIILLYFFVQSKFKDVGVSSAIK
ncbi:lactose/L-arabinose transport system permease [Enterococcus sp. AZ194]|uniref:carbohydrate ABC transporter permease n=1 Tax=Enterococcus sp. AZ194 TaxID=2774629 RepID=UPI003F29278B